MNLIHETFRIISSLIFLSKISYNFPHFQQSPFFYLTDISPLYLSFYLLLYFPPISPYLLRYFPLISLYPRRSNNHLHEIQSLYQCQKISIKIKYLLENLKLNYIFAKQIYFAISRFRIREFWHPPKSEIRSHDIREPDIRNPDIRNSYIWAIAHHHGVEGASPRVDSSASPRADSSVSLKAPSSASSRAFKSHFNPFNSRNQL